jgi:hypothetical protein
VSFDKQIAGFLPEGGNTGKEKKNEGDLTHCHQLILIQTNGSLRDLVGAIF